MEAAGRGRRGGELAESETAFGNPGRSNDEDAVALWRHTAWLVRYGNFAELKRTRLGRPDLPTVKWRQAQQGSATQART